jgi:hypothetical protein
MNRLLYETEPLLTQGGNTMRKSLLLAVLIALPGANAIAQLAPTLNVAIVKCEETAAPGTRITVFATDTTFPAGTLTKCTPSPAASCAACLQQLVRDFQCRGGTVFTSNAETTQPSVSSPVPPPTTSINKFVFACGPAVP